jgi:microsomal dipeptidase-like Zn-dependent dipeptidase
MSTRSILPKSNLIQALAAALPLALLCFPCGQAAAQTFNQIQFVITTGNDDLRGNSSATATLAAPNGVVLQVISLKAQNQPGWNNNSAHTVTTGLSPAQNASAIGSIVITLTSHNSFAETDDNWNIEGVVVKLMNNGANATELVNSSGNPLARLTGSGPSVTLHPQPAAPPGSFNQIQFVIATGDDDLRGDSSVTATLEAPNSGTLQVITLKAQNQPGWNNNTSRTVTATLSPPRTPVAIGHIVITLTSHNSLTETDDNWNVESVAATMLNNGAGARPLMSASGAPLARLTGSQPTLTLPQAPSGPAGTFNQIQFVIGTGSDDLRGDSSATATLQSPNGSPVQTLTLKAHNQAGWGNNTTHTVSLALKPPRAACAIGHIVITLASHNSFGETNDNWNVQSVAVTLSNNGAGQTSLLNGSGNPLARLTGDLPSLVLDGLGCMPNVLGPQPGTGRLRGFVDLHTHPLANLGFGGKLLYGGMDVGAMLPADPDCHHDVRATSMEQALGHDGSTHGQPGVGGPFSSGGFGIQNPCGDILRDQIIHAVQKGNGAADESDDADGAPDFREWPVWNDITHQKMWVDWIRRSFDGGLRVLVALAVNNKTLGDASAGPGDGPTDDKASADIQIAEMKAFVGRHPDFMEVAESSADLERIVREDKLAVVLGMEVDDIGDFNKVTPLTDAEITAEIDRLFREGVRYIFPIHLLDNPFGGTATYQDLMNYSNFRENGQWWDLECADPSINYTFKAQGFDLFTFVGEAAKLGISFALSSPPTYPQCGQRNKKGLTAQGEFAIKDMMQHGMLIDIDHMSELSQQMTIAIAQKAGSGYPLNSGHSGLRGYLPVSSGIFNEIDFVIGTGDDDLRGDSSATATLEAPDGSTLRVLALKTQDQPNWNNKTTHTVTLPLNPSLSSSAIGRLVVTLTSHNSATETDDNWNIESLSATLSNNGAGQTVLVSGSGDPLARLTGSQPSLTLPEASERSMNAALYAEIGKLHGMAGIGSVGLDAYQWTAMYQKVLSVMGNGAVAGFGTDTDGIAMGMPPRPGSSLSSQYSDSFPRSSLGTKWWNYDSDGVAHYGMLPDFLKDVRTAPGGAALVDDNLMFGADYFLQTWKECEALKQSVR